MGDVTSLVELNDSDLLVLEAVLEHITRQQGRVLPLEAFRKEIIARFELIGFGVDVKVWDTDQIGLFSFDVEIVRRLEGRFDPDQQVWEEVHDILELGEGGFLKPGLTVVDGHKHPPPH